MSLELLDLSPMEFQQLYTQDNYLCQVLLKDKTDWNWTNERCNSEEDRWKEILSGSQDVKEMYT